MDLNDIAALKVLRISVFTQCTQDFTQQGEVSDGASEILYAVLGDSGVHTHTSVGVFQLPKNATVELDLVAAVAGGRGSFRSSAGCRR